MTVLSPLRNHAYRQLFTAQVAALLGTGLATVALGLLAHDLAGVDAGEILGIALTIKMIAYVGVAPFASALAARLPRKSLLVSLDIVRAAVAAALPFVDSVWQVYCLMTVLYVASAAFTPAFQAMIPDLLPDEAEYTEALSLSRIAADLESVVSPVMAALLLTVMSYNNLFAGTAVGFVVSAAFVVSASLEPQKSAQARPFLKRLTAGLEIFARTPRLRGLVAISLAPAAGGAMVFVNTVVLVQSEFGLSHQATAWALATFGAGSIAAAALIPRLTSRFSDRATMTTGAAGVTLALIVGPWVATTYPAMLLLWAAIGFGYSLTITPAGRALRRSSRAEDRPALFAAQFALSHACWLIAYPAAGFVSAVLNPSTAFLVLAGLCAFGTILGLLLWPRLDPEVLEHRHSDLDPADPHLADGRAADSGDDRVHAHAFVIDDLHKHWPTARG